MGVDVVIVGGGPAGAIAALVLARAGVRVTVFDRARFPRHKLCGDTVNPGTMAELRRLGVDAAAGTFATPGMIVTGEMGVRVAGRYPDGMTGRAVLRQDLDLGLLEAAERAGARVEQEVLVRAATCTDASVDGVVIESRRGVAERIRAGVVIAADGRQSRVARDVDLARYSRAPRRWAVGAYFTGVHDMTTWGEMHLRRSHYIGVAPLPGGLTNACAVSADRRALRDPFGLLMKVLRTEPELADRFASAEPIGPPAILGPLAVDVSSAGVPGLLLAGDAAGFIDPLTGDGLRFAIRGAELAALETIRALEHGFADAHVRLRARREREFRTKWRFNRALRRLAGSPGGLRAAAAVASVLPAWVECAIRYAGDARAGRVREPSLRHTAVPPELEEQGRT